MGCGRLFEVRCGEWRQRLYQLANYLFKCCFFLDCQWSISLFLLLPSLKVSREKRDREASLSFVPVRSCPCDGTEWREEGRKTREDQERTNEAKPAGTGLKREKQRSRERSSESTGSRGLRRPLGEKTDGREEGRKEKGRRFSAREEKTRRQRAIHYFPSLLSMPAPFSLQRPAKEKAHNESPELPRTILPAGRNFLCLLFNSPSL